MSNPFVVGFYVPEEYFCNRSKETRASRGLHFEGKNAVLRSVSEEARTI